MAKTNIIKAVPSKAYKLMTSIGCLGEDILDIEQAKFSALHEIAVVEKALKGKEKELESYVHDLNYTVKCLTSMKADIQQMARELIPLLGKNPPLPTKRKKRKKKVIGNVIPFIAPDVLESRSEV